VKENSVWDLRPRTILLNCLAVIVLCCCCCDAVVVVVVVVCTGINKDRKSGRKKVRTTMARWKMTMERKLIQHNPHI